VAEVTSSARRVALAQLPLLAAGAFALPLLLGPGQEAALGPLLLAAGAYVLLYPARLAHAVLIGLQDLRFTAVVTTAAWLAGTAVSVSLVLAGTGIASVAIGWTVTQLATAVASTIRLRTRHRAAWPVGPLLPSAHDVRRWFGRSAWVTATQIAGLLRSGTDVLVIGRLLGTAAAVPFATTAKLCVVAGVFPPMLLANAQPGLAELRARADREGLVRASDALARLTLLASFGVGAAVLAGNRAFVGAWLGPAQFAGAAVSALVVANMVLRHGWASISSTLFAMGYERALAILAVVDGAVSVSLSVFLTGPLGLVGTAVAPIVGTVAISLPFGVWALGRETGRAPARVAFQTIAWCWPLVAVAVAAGASSLLPLRGFAGALAAAIAVGLPWLGIARWRLSRPPLARYAAPVADALRARWAQLRRPRVGADGGGA
jgi:O-antigen/teichoic acid export membrane protein